MLPPLTYPVATPTSRGSTSILQEFELQTHAQTRTVIEAAKLWAGKVVLHVARVEMISDVEDRNAGAASVFLTAKRNHESFHYQHIERKQMRKAASGITLAYKVLLLIQSGKRKAVTPINYRRNHYRVRQRKITPKQ